MSCALKHPKCRADSAGLEPSACYLTNRCACGWRALVE